MLRYGRKSSFSWLTYSTFDRQVHIFGRMQGVVTGATCNVTVLTHAFNALNHWGQLSNKARKERGAAGVENSPRDAMWLQQYEE